MLPALVPAHTWLLRGSGAGSLPGQALPLCFDVAAYLPGESQPASAWRCCLQSLIIKYCN